MRQDYLFSDGGLRDYLDRAHQQLLAEIDGLSPDTVIQTDTEELTNYVIAKYTVTIPTIEDERITVDQQETKIDISQDPTRLLIDRSRPFYITGTRVTYHVPFTGNADLFRLRPSYYSSRFPDATVDEQELTYHFDETSPDASSLKAAFADTLNETKKLLAWANNDVTPYNAQIAATARERLTARRDKLVKDHSLAQTLGYPLRKRENAPQTYILPTKRKTISLPPRTPNAPPEPTLEDTTYEHILSIVQNMVLVMERSPRAFRTMGEEDLRMHFLVQLNGQYEGQATGETFNGEGKTDILIRHDNKNLFIAECKFWIGPQSLTDAIDQLLSYATWRDAKTAIFVFSRNKDFTNVISQIPAIVAKHPNTVRAEQYPNETGYRFTLRQKHDPQRFIVLTVLAFNIPT